jgi:hypothetical protein
MQVGRSAGRLIGLYLVQSKHYAVNTGSLLDNACDSLLT